MTAQDSKDRNPERDMNVEQVAGELLSEMVRTDERASLPPSLAKRLIAIGESEVAKATLGAPVAVLARAEPRRAADRSVGWTMRAGWVLAAAAMVAWLLVPSPFAGRRDVTVVTASEALYDSLLAMPEVVRVPWAASTDPSATAATGEVVWDAATQRGVLRFVGLVPNDPRLAQYQLWIIDADRDARYPVDGGVFDVTESGEVLIPISARLRVGRPSLFAVTLERPGGVVVSSRERLVLAAPVEG